MRYRRVALTMALAAVVIASFTSGAVAAGMWGVFRGYDIIRVKVDGVDVMGDTPAILFGDRTMVPVRFVSEALGAKVEWDDHNRTVLITKPSTVSPPTDSTPDPTTGTTSNPPASPPVSSEPMSVDQLKTYLNAKYASVSIAGGVYHFTASAYVSVGSEPFVDLHIDSSEFSAFRRLYDTNQSEVTEWVRSVGQDVNDCLKGARFFGLIMYQERWSFIPSSFDIDDISVTSDGEFLVTHSEYTFDNWYGGTRVSHNDR